MGRNGGKAAHGDVDLSIAGHNHAHHRVRMIRQGDIQGRRLRHQLGRRRDRRRLLGRAFGTAPAQALRHLSGDRPPGKLGGAACEPRGRGKLPGGAAQRPSGFPDSAAFHSGQAKLGGGGLARREFMGLPSQVAFRRNRFQALCEVVLTLDVLLFAKLPVVIALPFAVLDLREGGCVAGCRSGDGSRMGLLSHECCLPQQADRRLEFGLPCQQRLMNVGLLPVALRLILFRARHRGGVGGCHLADGMGVCLRRSQGVVARFGKDGLKFRLAVQQNLLVRGTGLRPLSSCSSLLRQCSGEAIAFLGGAVQTRPQRINLGGGLFLGARDRQRMLCPVGLQPPCGLSRYLGGEGGQPVAPDIAFHSSGEGLRAHRQGGCGQ